jgi:hypothetical protein
MVVASKWRGRKGVARYGDGLAEPDPRISKVIVFLPGVG